MLQMLGALDVPTSGTVTLDDVELSDAGERRLQEVRAERVGIVFQNFNLIATLSALENVQTALVPLGVGAEERLERSRAALDQVAMGDRADHLPSELSGGQQQRVAIAQALVKRPRCCWPTKYRKPGWPHARRDPGAAAFQLARNGSDGDHGHPRLAGGGQRAASAAHRPRTAQRDRGRASGRRGRAGRVLGRCRWGTALPAPAQDHPDDALEDATPGASHQPTAPGTYEERPLG